MSWDLGKQGATPQVNKNGAGAGAAALTTSFTAGSTFNVGKASDCAIWVVNTGANGTNMTAQVWKLQISYDGTNWVDTYATRSSTAVTAVEHTITTVNNSTVYESLMTTNARLQLYARIMVKATAGGALVAGDIAKAFVVVG